MEQTTATLGIFAHLDALETAMVRLQDHGWKVVDVYSPVPSHRIEQALEPGPSRIRVFTLLGALTGVVSGVWLAIWSSVKWGLITGGKPIVSLPPFLIIGFELALLFGALATVAGLLLTARLCRTRRDAYYDARFSEDHFGLVVAGPSQDQAEIVDVLSRAGAEEVRGGERV